MKSEGLRFTKTAIVSKLLSDRDVGLSRGNFADKRQRRKGTRRVVGDGGRISAGNIAAVPGRHRKWSVHILIACKGIQTETRLTEIHTTIDATHSRRWKQRAVPGAETHRIQQLGPELNIHRASVQRVEIVSFLSIEIPD